MESDDASSSIGTSTLTFVQPLNVQWAPQPDITAHELALCTPILIAGSLRMLMPYDIDRRQPYARHFKIHDPKETAE